MNTENMIEVTDWDLSKMVSKVYELSKPAGMGFLHYKAGPLEEDEVANMVKLINESAGSAIGSTALHLDYVFGRCCKFVVRKDENNKLWIREFWMDHSEQDMVDLIEHCKGEQDE